MNGGAETAAEARAVRIGLIVAVAVAVALLAGGGAYAALHRPPSRYDLVTRCLTNEKGIVIETSPFWDDIALSAAAGAFTVTIEENRVTVSLAGSIDETDRLLAAYVGSGVPRDRLTQRGRLVAIWTRPPSPTQLQTLYDCTY